MPDGMTPERMCDWDWMTHAIADLKPLATPGTKTMYLSMTFGWILGELIRRADPKHRSLGRFVREEIAIPLGAPDLWIGLPDSELPRVATQVDAMVPVPAEYLPPLFTASMPEAVGLVPPVFERPDVRRAEVAGVGGIFTARSEARFWAMLAGGGELDGVRLLSSELVAALNTPRARSEEPDPVMFGFPIPITVGGFWFGGAQPPVCSAKSPRAICHPGQGRFDRLGRSRQRPGRGNLPQPAVQPDDARRRHDPDDRRCAAQRLASLTGSTMTAIPRIQDFDDPTYNPFLSDDASFGANLDPYPQLADWLKQGPVHEMD
jgi:CubicO group peptidase (beta-lactamase class C family)